MPATALNPRARCLAELAEASHLAQREFPVVGTNACPTPWDRMHARINVLLDVLDRLPSAPA